MMKRCTRRRGVSSPISKKLRVFCPKVRRDQERAVPLCLAVSVPLLWDSHTQDDLIRWSFNSRVHLGGDENIKVMQRRRGF